MYILHLYIFVQKYTYFLPVHMCVNIYICIYIYIYPCVYAYSKSSK